MQNTTLNTPYFHILETDLDRDVSLLKQSLTDSWGNWIVGYSVKTNSLPWLLCYMKEQGFYAEIVSDTEYRLAKRLGFPDSHMIYNGPVKDRQIFTDILLAGGLVNLDSSEEPQWLSELSAPFSRPPFFRGRTGQLRYRLSLPGGGAGGGGGRPLWLLL